MIRSVSTFEPGNGTKIMSYNVLAQCLVRREQYPTSGKFLRWGQRSKAFGRELEAYDPDIFLIQELDADHRRFWRDLLEPRGMHCVFHQHVTKRHGLAICFKTTKFALTATYPLDLDAEITLEAPRQCETNNVAVFTQLVSKISGQSLLVGTAHLYWHPDASYERSRQMLCILNAIERLRECSLVIFGGDCNTEYFDPPYLLATGQKLDDRAEKIMQKSLKAPSFDRMGAVQVVHGVASTLALHPSAANAAPNLVADGAEAAKAGLLHGFSKSPLRFSSFYSRYKDTGREAAECGEPLFTNWTEVFKGTLDYLFCVHDKDHPEGRLQGTPGRPPRVLELLDIPTHAEMGPKGLPQAGLAPSDHVCVMAKVLFT